MRFFSLIAALPAAARAAAIAAMIAVIGGADIATGSEIAFSIFYTVPVSAAAWALNRRGALTVAALCGGVWLGADAAAGHTYSSAWVPVWNTCVRTSFFVLIALLVERVRRSLAAEHETARMDSLTQLPNSRRFAEEAARELSRCRRNGDPITIAYLDLDNFKLVNDRMGHARGDDLLRDIAFLLKSLIRVPDTLARVGGDEFALLLPGAGAADAAPVLNRLLAAVQELARSQHLPVGISIGAVAYPAVPDSIDDMVRHADELMYEVKRSGKGSVRLVEESAPGPDLVPPVAV